MTRPLVHPIPTTRRHHADGVSFAFAHRSRSEPFAADPLNARRPALASRVIVTFRAARCGIGEVTRPAHENRGLNTHGSSAVPFNMFFPHS